MYNVLLLLLTFCLAPVVVAQESVPNTDTTKVPPDSFFLAKEKEVWEALKNKDKASADRLLADDFVGIIGDGGVFTRAEWLKQIDGQYIIDAYAIEDPKLLRPSPTTALLLYRSTCKGTGVWADSCSHTMYISDLWVQHDGEWEAFFSQDTPAVPPPTSMTGTGSPAETEKADRGGATEQNDKTLVAKIVGFEKSLWEDAAFPGPSARESLLAKDLEIIKHGHRFTIAEEAKQFGDVHPASFTMEDVHAKVLSPDVILLTYRAKASWKGPYRGKETASLPPQILWVTSVWTRREQRWVNTLYEENPRDEFY